VVKPVQPADELIEFGFEGGDVGGGFFGIKGQRLPALGE
jgi:hypothetical protein